MKFSLYIDPSREEEVVVYARKKSLLTEKLEQITEEFSNEIIGYTENEITKLNISDVICFIVENNRIYALTNAKKYLIKQRLYNLEENFSKSFVKINQSCLANINKIERFDSSISCTLKVVFKNGYTDYVSRRNVKAIKERLGL